MNTKDIINQARFWAKVNVISHNRSDACWEWQGAMLPNGYGQCSNNGKSELAHRYSASLSEDIEGKVVMHTCDNPCCVRPDHLVVADQWTNMQDMILKDRKSTKLSRQAVLDIRTKQLSRKEYSVKYMVSVYTIGEVQRGRTWNWL